jgi:signal transduction histidine kinase
MASKHDRRSLTVRSEVRPDGEIEISVTDTGTGIAIEDTERVFNPLFTTKSGGMGMGLSICRSIIEAHDGQLSVIPNVPAGSIFRFALRPAQ